MSNWKLSNAIICVIGMGYVGLPLAIELSKFFRVVGFDTNRKKISDMQTGKFFLNKKKDFNFSRIKKIKFTSEIRNIASCNTYIVAVPTPIDLKRNPDLSALKKASHTIGNVIKAGNLVIFESTVFPGATEQICVPIIEKKSKLFLNKDFLVGYSPERISPGDKKRGLKNIVKVVSGSNKKALKCVDSLYRKIISKGTFKVSTIKVAEASKIIENIQRDVNIALMNEAAIIFNELGIDIEEVIDAAKTKWNFQSYTPGLVGGHCIGVDPYYLSHKAKSIGVHSDLILTSRRINEFMPAYVSKRLKKALQKKKINLKKAKILIMGITFKDNCSDIRNTKIVDLVKNLKKFISFVDMYDPWASKVEVKKLYNIKLIPKIRKNFYDCIILAVSHKEFKEMGIRKIKSFAKKISVIYDMKHLFKRSEIDEHL